MKRVAILQSNYIPWKGYFDLIASVDEFIFYDDVQYTHTDWRNRNRIKTPQGVQWLTVPVGRSMHRQIREVTVTQDDCGPAHWQRLQANYARAPHFESEARWLAPHFTQVPWRSLSALNQRLIGAVCDRLRIGTRLANSTDYACEGDRNERLAALCRASGAAVYVSGPAARDYLDAAVFARSGVAVEWFDYSGYPAYPQLWGPFVHEVSVLDLLFNCGDAAARHMKHVRA